MKIDQAPEGGKFRAEAASALNGTTGAWGDTDMLCVQFDGNGDLVVSAAGDNCDGIIWTKEGRKTLSDGTDDNVIGARKYTVFTFCELVEVEIGSSPALSEGDAVYATANGDVTTSPATGDIYIGTVLNGGSRMIVNVNGRPAAA